MTEDQLQNLQARYEQIKTARTSLESCKKNLKRIVELSSGNADFYVSTGRDNTIPIPVAAVKDYYEHQVRLLTRKLHDLETSFAGITIILPETENAKS